MQGIMLLNLIMMLLFSYSVNAGGLGTEYVEATSGPWPQAPTFAGQTVYWICPDMSGFSNYICQLPTSATHYKVVGGGYNCDQGSTPYNSQPYFTGETPTGWQVSVFGAFSCSIYLISVYDPVGIFNISSDMALINDPDGNIPLNKLYTITRSAPVLTDNAYSSFGCVDPNSPPDSTQLNQLSQLSAGYNVANGNYFNASVYVAYNEGGIGTTFYVNIGFLARKRESSTLVGGNSQQNPALFTGNPYSNQNPAYQLTGALFTGNPAIGVPECAGPYASYPAPNNNAWTTLWNPGCYAPGFKVYAMGFSYSGATSIVAPPPPISRPGSPEVTTSSNELLGLLQRLYPLWTQANSGTVR